MAFKGAFTNLKKNMGFGLKMRGFDSQEVEKSIHKAASILQIEHLLERVSSLIHINYVGLHSY